MHLLAGQKSFHPSGLKRAAVLRQKRFHATNMKMPTDKKADVDVLNADMMALTVDVDRGLKCSVRQSLHSLARAFLVIKNINYDYEGHIWRQWCIQ
jgi:hypothetical protein